MQGQHPLRINKRSNTPVKPTGVYQVHGTLNTHATCYRILYSMNMAPKITIIQCILLF